MIRVGGGRVEVAGRLVGEDQLRPVHQRARDRHALQLAARKRLRQARARSRRGRPPRASPRPARRRARPCSSSGRPTLCGTLRCGSTWKAWNTKPRCSRRNSRLRRLGQRRRCRCRRCAPSRRRRVSSPAMQLSSVDLPTPDSPTMATNSPARPRGRRRRRPRSRRSAWRARRSRAPASAELLRPRRSAPARATTWAVASGASQATTWRARHAAQPGELALGELAGGGDAASRAAPRGRRPRAPPRPGGSRRSASTAGPACRSPRARSAPHLVDQAGGEHRREALADALVQPGAVARLERDQRRRLGAAACRVCQAESGRPLSAWTSSARWMRCASFGARRAAVDRVDRRQLGVQRRPAVASPPARRVAARTAGIGRRASRRGRRTAP